MSYDDRGEILERLEALEELVRSHLGGRSSRRDDDGRRDREGGRHERRHERRDDRRHHEHDRSGGREEFQEKRIIDTIVRLVSEQVSRVVQDQQARSRPRDDGGGEKRVVDLIVGLVSEHVQEIVSAELDRRFGPEEQERPTESHDDPPEAEEA